MRFTKLAGIIFGALALLLAVPLLGQDPATVPSAEIITGGGLLLSVLGVMLTGVFKLIGAQVDGTTARADGWLIALYKPIQPIVAAGVALALGVLATKFPGLPLPSADSLMAAPASIPVAIALREVFVRVWKKLHSL